VQIQIQEEGVDSPVVRIRDSLGSYLTLSWAHPPPITPQPLRDSSLLSTGIQNGPSQMCALNVNNHNLIRLDFHLVFGLGFVFLVCLSHRSLSLFAFETKVNLRQPHPLKPPYSERGEVRNRIGWPLQKY